MASCAKSIFVYKNIKNLPYNLPVFELTDILSVLFPIFANQNYYKFRAKLTNEQKS